MLSKNNIAFKEWAVVINALAQGKQNIILRKGGIREKNGEFRVDHNEFFLFPTYEHQDKEDLKPAFHSDLDWVIRGRGPENEAALRYYVQAEKVYRIDDEKLLAKISDFHIWSDREIKKRFDYGKNKGIYLIVVRVFELLFPHVIQITPQYAGCKSWVELGRSLEICEPTPKISDAGFSTLHKQISKIIGQSNNS